MNTQTDVKKPWAKRHPILTGFGLLIILFIVIGSIGGDKTPTTTQQTNNNSTASTPREVEQPVVLTRVTASQLAKEYKANGVSADAKYKNRTIEISGTVKSISRDILDDAYITLNGDANSFTDVQCMFSADDEGALLNLSEGSQVVVQGEVDSMLLNVLVRDCKVITN